MAGKNYRRGTWVEDQAVLYLVANGYWAERSHASKGTFDVRALSPIHTLLISCRRSKPRIVSDKAVLNANRDTILKLALLPTPPNARKEFWHYQDRQKGDHAGIWRRYLIDGTTVTPVPMPPIPRGKDLKAAETKAKAIRDKMKACESADMPLKKTPYGYEITLDV
jgi:hypothetical protein